MSDPTNAERQARHRARQQAKHVALEAELRARIAELESENARLRAGGAPADAKPTATPLLSRQEIKKLADDLGIDFDGMDKLIMLLTRHEMYLWQNDPKEAARWLLRELGWAAFQDVWEAISEVRENDDKESEEVPDEDRYVTKDDEDVALWEKHYRNLVDTHMEAIIADMHRQAGRKLTASEIADKFSPFEGDNDGDDEC